MPDSPARTESNCACSAALRSEAIITVMAAAAEPANGSSSSGAEEAAPEHMARACCTCMAIILSRWTATGWFLLMHRRPRLATQACQLGQEPQVPRKLLLL